ncbi:trypsin-1-like protein [Dinothrombium tinctorium]|uniref:Trypsin-1-like protein n=1 Tax=Dinothrombium tinctorium TaxID=1965070 RepID=A0A3S3P8Q3_9ACAR|nr:trypsin-1-like protein [Dinothrombium tinctorium]
MINVGIVIISLFFFLRTLNAEQCSCGKLIGSENNQTNDYKLDDLRKFVVVVTDDEVKCGGALIYDRWVVTSAQCVEAIDDLKIITGNGQMINVIKVITHPKFRDARIYLEDVNDVALLKLEKRVKFDSKVLLPCLPTKFMQKFENLISFDFDRSNIVAVNMGGEKQVEAIKVKSYNNIYIERRINETKAYLNTQINVSPYNYVKCFNGEAKGTPLLTEVNGRFYLVGIYIRNKCDNRNPNNQRVYFTRITSFIEWLFSYVNEDSKWCANRSESKISIKKSESVFIGDILSSFVSDFIISNGAVHYVLSDEN